MPGHSTLTLPERIKIARHRAGLDQDQAATAVGVSRQLVSKWERGKSVPDLIETVRLAHVTGVPIEWFTDDLIDLTDQDVSGTGWRWDQAERPTENGVQGTLFGPESNGPFDSWLIFTCDQHVKPMSQPLAFAGRSQAA